MPRPHPEQEKPLIAEIEHENEATLKDIETAYDPIPCATTLRSERNSESVKRLG